MALVHSLFLSLLILLTVLHPGAANYVPLKSQEADASLADSLAAWQKDGLEPLGELEAHVKADDLRKSSVIEQMHNSTVLPKTREKQKEKTGESPQADSKHSETAGETTKEVPNGHEHIESVSCHGAGCMIGIATVLVAVPTIILMGSLAIYCWYDKKRRLPGDRQEHTGLITGADSQASSPEPALH